MFSQFGGYYTEKFSDIWPNVNAWRADYELFKEMEIIPLKNLEFINKVYYLLVSEYGFSHHIGSRDQFKLMLWQKVFQYAPYLEKEIEIQNNLLSMELKELQQGGKAIYNTALNPGTQPTTTTLGELEYINQQNTTNYKKSKPEAWAVLMQLIKKDLGKEFTSRFKNLFIKVCYPDYPLYYINDPNATGGIEND